VTWVGSVKLNFSSKFFDFFHRGKPFSSSIPDGVLTPTGPGPGGTRREPGECRRAFDEDDALDLTSLVEQSLECGVAVIHYHITGVIHYHITTVMSGRHAGLLECSAVLITTTVHCVPSLFTNFAHGRRNAAAFPTPVRHV